MVTGFGGQQQQFDIYGNPIPAGTGYQWNGNGMAQQSPVIKDFLTPEEMQKLQQEGSEFNLMLTKEEQMKARCRHRSIDGRTDMLTEVTDENGETRLRCSRCGFEFVPVDPNENRAAIQEAVNSVVNVLQTIKMIYITMPEDAAREYFQVIGLLMKLPDLFKYATDDYFRHEQYSGYGFNNRNMSGVNLFSALLGGIPGAAPMGGFDPNQQMAYGYQQPQQGYGFGQPMGQAYQQPQSNGFGYNMNQPVYQQPQMQGQPMGQPYQPQSNGFQFVPNQQQPVQQAAPTVAPTTPAQETTATATIKA